MARRNGDVPTYLDRVFGISELDAEIDAARKRHEKSGPKWVCPRCGTTNYYDSENCSRCGNMNPN